MIQQQGHIFIDPESCGSSVGYYITINEKYKAKETDKTKYSMSAIVVLADCSHKIDWAFEEDCLDKIDTAIAKLQEFRKKYIETQKHVEKLNK